MGGGGGGHVEGEEKRGMVMETTLLSVLIGKTRSDEYNWGYVVIRLYISPTHCYIEAHRRRRGIRSSAS